MQRGSAAQRLSTELDIKVLINGPAEACDEVLEAQKLSAGRIYHNLTVWSTSVLETMCTPWEDALKPGSEARIESKASPVFC